MKFLKLLLTFRTQILGYDPKNLAVKRHNNATEVDSMHVYYFFDVRRGCNISQKLFKIVE